MLAPIRPICNQTQEKKKKNPNLCSTTGQNVGGGDQIERTSDKHTHTHTHTKELDSFLKILFLLNSLVHSTSYWHLSEDKQIILEEHTYPQFKMGVSPYPKVSFIIK
jgi:hypothetical protein